MRFSSDKTALLFALGLLAALLLPTSNLMRLDGLPLATPLELVALLVAAPLALWASVRGEAWRQVQRLRCGPWAAWLILCVVLAAKIVLLAAGPMQGWPGCYRPGIAPIGRYGGPLISPHCERSFENPFFRGDVTRFDQSIAFDGDTWNLGFLNSSRFDFYDWQPDMPLRTRLPFEASWSGPLEVSPAGVVRVEYVGEGELQVADAHMVLAPSYAMARSVEFPLGAGTSTMQLRYRFDDGSRSGQDPDLWGPRAMLRISLTENGVPPTSLAAPRAGTWAALAIAADLALGMLVIAGALALAISSRRDLLVVILIAGAAAGLCLIPPTRVDYIQRVFGGLPLLQVSFAVLAMLLLTVHERWRRLSPLVIYLALAALAVATMRQAYPSWDYVSIRSAGNDNLVYESQARTILQTGSLQGGEEVYFYKFLYRYIKFGEHILFGDGDVLYGSVMLLVALGGVFFALERFRLARLNGPRGAVWLLAGAALLGVTGYYVARIVRDGLSEYPAWIAMFWAFPLLFAGSRDRDLVVGALFLGLGSLTRTNQMPGNAIVLAAALLVSSRRRWTDWILAWAAFGVPFLLFLFHTVVYGNASVISAGPVASFNLALGPNQWIGLLRGDRLAMSAVWNQVRLLLFTVPLDDWQAPVGIFAHLVMSSWLAAVWTARRIGWRVMTLLLLPLPFLVTHLIFVALTYYPRHVIMAILVMALGVLAALKGAREEIPLGNHEPAPGMG